MALNTSSFLPRIFQWAGGKTKMIKHYDALLPNKALPLVEPFAGGAALFSHLSATGSNPLPATLGDTNAELIGLYTHIRDRPDAFLDRVRGYNEDWSKATPQERKPLYYGWRKTYWDIPAGLEATALLYALMRTSFNGIWQTCKDSHGLFGTPVGLVNKPGGFLSESAIRAWSEALQATTLHTGSFETIPINDPSFVFCDPPYRDSFTDYSTGFNDTHQRALIEWCRRVHVTTGSTVWLANRDANDRFFEEHAGDALLHRFPVTYTAGRRKKTEDGYAAKPATELLMIWR